MSQKPNNVLRAKENALPKTGTVNGAAIAMQKNQLLAKKVSINKLNFEMIFSFNIFLYMHLANN